MEESEPIFKVITLGDSGVGKTSIITRYTSGTFKEHRLSTAGSVFHFKDVVLKDGTKIKLKLIDTAGQEKYRAMAKSYYKNAQGILLIFSYDSKKRTKSAKGKRFK